VDQFDVDAELRKMDDGKETVGLAGTKARPHSQAHYTIIANEFRGILPHIMKVHATYR
jgi:hypothetical protein